MRAEVIVTAALLAGCNPARAPGSAETVGVLRPNPSAMVRIAGAQIGVVFETQNPPVVFRQVPSFEIDVTEVTVAQYRQCVAAGHCTAPQPTVFIQGRDRFEEGCTAFEPGHEHFPVTCVDYYQASTYCAWAGKRLPTDPEWLLASRGPEQRKFAWGNRYSLERQCWLTCDVRASTADVTPEGVAHLQGNAAEWTASRWCEYYPPCPAHIAYMVRGNAAGSLRHFFPWEPDTRTARVGFRCVR